MSYDTIRAARVADLREKLAGGQSISLHDLWGVWLYATQVDFDGLHIERYEIAATGEVFDGLGSQFGGAMRVLGRDADGRQTHKTLSNDTLIRIVMKQPQGEPQ